MSEIPESVDDRYRRLDFLADWRQQIPPVLRKPGTLDPRVAQWLAGLGPWGQSATNLILVGDTGTGKTWHAWHAIEAAYSGRFCGWARFVDPDYWREMNGNTSLSYEDPRNHGKGGFGFVRDEAHIVVLDDIVGGLKMNDHDHELLYSLADSRCNRKRATIVCTNTPDLRGALGARVSDRLKPATIVVLDGPSRR